MSFKKTLVLTGVFTGLLVGSFATSALATDRPLISQADVKVELDDINANALDYWPTIEKDLEAKLVEEIAPVFSGDGYDITIRLAEISIDGSALLGNEGEFNTLLGWVYIREQGNPDPVESVRVALTAKTGDTQVDTPETTIIIAPARNAFYDALLSRFAERTVEEVQEL